MLKMCGDNLVVYIRAIFLKTLDLKNRYHSYAMGKRTTVNSVQKNTTNKQVTITEQNFYILSYRNFQQENSFR